MTTETSSEKWAKIAGYRGYEISSRGAVRSYWKRVGPPGSSFDKWKWAIAETNPKPLTISTNEDGYSMVRMQSKERVQKFICVHLLVLKAFVGPRPDGHHGCHKDDDKTNNTIDNLEWGTPEKNLKDRFRNHRGMKLGKEQVHEIRARLATGERQVSIAKSFKVHQSLISSIKIGRNWYYV